MHTLYNVRIGFALFYVAAFCSVLIFHFRLHNFSDDYVDGDDCDDECDRYDRKPCSTYPTCDI